MYCEKKHRECEYAGILITQGCVELGEKEGYRIHPVCHKDKCVYGESDK